MPSPGGPRLRPREGLRLRPEDEEGLAERERRELLPLEPLRLLLEPLLRLPSDPEMDLEVGMVVTSVVAKRAFPPARAAET